MEAELDAIDGWILQVDQWSQAFDRELLVWSQWLTQMQRQFVIGSFQGIESLCREGEVATRSITGRLEERRAMLASARELGIAAGSLRDAVLQSTSPIAKRLAKQLSEISMKLHGVRQQSMSLWITACQSQIYTEDILRILSTGEADSATYSPAEASCGGGRLIDQAA